MTVYLDCNATTPMEPRVLDAMLPYFTEEYGNAGSRTHVFGQRAKKAVDIAREQVAAVVDCQPDEVIFTSGATESNNLAILGLQRHGEATGRQHIVSTMIEHKSVLEPLAEMERRGFRVDLVPPTQGGWVSADAVSGALQKDTLLVSVMHANNETGVVQPLSEIASLLASHEAYLHVDAAQGFGKDMAPLRNRRLDLISVSAHKIFGPKGAGCLIARRRRYRAPPIQPLMFGGGQELGLRSGTLAVAQIVGLGESAHIAACECLHRQETCKQYRADVLSALEPLRAEIHGDTNRALPHVLNVSIPGVDGEAAILALRNLVAVSNGSACTSTGHQPSHVLTAMALPTSQVEGALRLSWSHLSPPAPWNDVVSALSSASRTSQRQSATRRA